ncbi:MAG: hypothetical protein NTV01_11290 [Bacteroidia bacterium]|nr:hypothetical protein [Bacteroidia bacterium]
MAEGSYEQEILKRLLNYAYNNLYAFILGGIAWVFKVWYVGLLSGSIAICLINIGFTAYSLREAGKHKALLSNFTKVRLKSYRIMALSLGLIILSIMKLTIKL